MKNEVTIAKDFEQTFRCSLQRREEGNLNNDGQYADSVLQASLTGTRKPGLPPTNPCET